MKILLSHDFFIKYGFYGPQRFWDIKRKQFGILYNIEGYDCELFFKPVQQVLPIKDPKLYENKDYQFNFYSDIDFLINHHINEYNVFVNSLQNHLTTFHYEIEVIKFMAICQCPLTSNK